MTDAPSQAEIEAALRAYRHCSLICEKIVVVREMLEAAAGVRQTQLGLEGVAQG